MAITEIPRVLLSRWLRAILGRTSRFVVDRVEPDRIRFICWTMLATNLMMLAVSFATSDAGRTALSSLQGADYAALGGDYAAFHNAGLLLNRHPPRRIYDLEFQAQLYHELFPKIARDKTLYFAHPPFIASLMRPLALLPYSWSYLVWLAISLGLYVAGLRLVWVTSEALPRGEWPLVLLLALSFQPFVMESWRGGQLAPFGFFWVASALHCWKARNNLGAGVALGFCLYKPTFLFLILPMLLISRQFRTLLGFTACGLGLGLVSLAAVGERGCLDYLEVLKVYSRSSVNDGSFLVKTKFVDLSSFLSLAHGRNSGAVLAATAVFMMFTLSWLAIRWWRLDRCDGPDRTLLFASTFTVSLVVNLHVAVYDTILAVPGILVTAGVLHERQRETCPPLTPTFKGMLVLVYLVPCFSQLLATATGFQPYTLVLAALGWYQLALCHGVPAAREVSAPHVGSRGSRNWSCDSFALPGRLRPCTWFSRHRWRPCSGANPVIESGISDGR